MTLRDTVPRDGTVTRGIFLFCAACNPHIIIPDSRTRNHWYR